MSNSTEIEKRNGGELQREDGPHNMMEAILRAVSDPTIDPARLREFIAAGKELELIQLQRDDREAKKQYNIAWAQMMPKMPTISKEGRIEYKPGTRPTQFAKWDDIHPACMPILYEHGFAVSFDSLTTDNKLQIILIITHVGGHEERRTFALPAQDTGGSKSPGQAASSAYTLGQRYQLGLNIALFGKNLSGETYFVGGMTLAAALGHNAAAVGEPRTYGLELSYRY